MKENYNKEFIKETITYLNKLIKKGAYIRDINYILDILINEINNISDNKEKKAILEKLESLTIKCKKYKKYKTEHNSFSILENKIEYEKLSRELDSLTYNYVFKMLTRYKGLIYMDSIFKKYKDYLDVCDENCNSLLYNLVLYYLEKGGEYNLTCISYILEVSSKDYKSDIKRINKEIKKYKDKGERYLRIKDLEGVLSSYYPESPKNKVTSVNASYIKRNNYGGETFRHNKKLTPSDYKDRIDLLDDISFGVTNSDFVENTYNIKVLPNGNIEIYHNIADVSAFLKPNSKIEKHAEKQIFMMSHKNHTGSLYPPKFLKEYVSLNPYEEKLAITVKHTFSESGKYLGSEAFRSVIYTGQVFKKEQINYLINDGENKKLNDFYKLMKNQKIKRGEFSYKSPSNILIQETNRLSANFLNEFMKRKKIPVIYETSLDLRAFDVYDDVVKFTNKKMDYKTSEDFKSLFDRIKPIQREFLIDETRGSILKIDEPFRTYLDYENIKNLDKLLKDGKLSKGALLALKDNLRILSVRASALDLSQKRL